MSNIKQFVLRKDHVMMRMLILFVLPAIVLFTIALTASADTTYLINDGGEIRLYTTNATNPAQIVSEAGFAVGADDLVTAEGGMVSEITIQRVQMVTIDNGGQVLKTGTYGETVAELLERLNLTLDEDDTINAELTAETYDGMALTISRRSVITETYSQTVPFATEYIDDETIPEGEEAVITEGRDGEMLCAAEVIYENGAEVSRRVTSETETQAPVTQVVARGTGKARSGELTIRDGVITLPDGTVYTYDSTMQVKATAYTHTDAGCNMITATGTTVRWGTVAVDPRLIPYGTRMFIVSNDGKYVYGVSAAEDCGGSIKGNRIDLYMPTTSECFQFGTRNCTVYFLG